MNPEADEHDLGGDRCLRSNRVTSHDEVFLPPLRLQVAILMEYDPGTVYIDASSEHRHRLEPAIVLATFLESELFEVLRDVSGCIVIPGGSRHTALAGIVGKEAQMRLDAAGVYHAKPFRQRVGGYSGVGCGVWKPRIDRLFPAATCSKNA